MVVECWCWCGFWSTSTWRSWCAVPRCPSSHVASMPALPQAGDVVQTGKTMLPSLVVCQGATEGRLGLGTYWRVEKSSYSCLFPAQPTRSCQKACQRAFGVHEKIAIFHCREGVKAQRTINKPRLYSCLSSRHPWIKTKPYLMGWHAQLRLPRVFRAVGASQSLD